MHTSIQAIFVISTIMQTFRNRVFGQIPYGFMVDPPARGAIWRFGFPAIVNYNDNALGCGGFEVLQRTGRCGVCGDSVEGPLEHEAGGVYASGTIVKSYPIGTSTIPITIETMEYKPGYFEFRLCPHNDPTTVVSQTCLDNHLLKLKEGTIESQGTQFRIPYHQSHVYTINARVPEGISCSQCVLQWKYSSGNDSKVYEEYRNCADISILPQVNATQVEQHVPQSTTAPQTQDVASNEFLTALMLLADVSPSGEMNVSSIDPMSNTGADQFIDNLLNSGILVPVGPDVTVLGAGVVAGSVSGTALLNQNPPSNQQNMTQNESKGSLVHESISWSVQPFQHTNGQDFLWYSKESHGQNKNPNQESTNFFNGLPASGISESHTTEPHLVSDITPNNVYNKQQQYYPTDNVGRNTPNEMVGFDTRENTLSTTSMSTTPLDIMTNNNPNYEIRSPTDNSVNPNIMSNHFQRMPASGNEPVNTSWNKRVTFPITNQNLLQSTQSGFENIHKSRLDHAFSTQVSNFNANYFGRRGPVDNTTPSIMANIASSEFTHSDQASPADNSRQNNPDSVNLPSDIWPKSMNSPATGPTPIKIFFNVSGMDNMFTIETLNHNSTRGEMSNILPPGNKPFLTWNKLSEQPTQNMGTVEMQGSHIMNRLNDAKDSVKDIFDGRQNKLTQSQISDLENYGPTQNTNDYSVYVISSPDTTKNDGMTPHIQNVFDSSQRTLQQSRSDNYAMAGSLQPLRPGISAGSKPEQTIEAVAEQTLEKPINPSQTTDFYSLSSGNGLGNGISASSHNGKVSYTKVSTNLFSSDISPSNIDHHFSRKESTSPLEKLSNTFVTSTPTVFEGAGFDSYHHFAISHPTDTKANLDYNNLPKNSQLHSSASLEGNIENGNQNYLDMTNMISWTPNFESKATQPSSFETVSERQNLNGDMFNKRNGLFNAHGSLSGLWVDRKSESGIVHERQISATEVMETSPEISVKGGLHPSSATITEASVPTAKFWKGNPFSSSSLFVHKSTEEVPLVQSSDYSSINIQSTPATQIELDVMQRTYKNFAISHPQHSQPTDNQTPESIQLRRIPSEQSSSSYVDMNNKITSNRHLEMGNSSISNHLENSFTAYSSQSGNSQTTDTKDIVSVPKEEIKYHTKEPWVEPGSDNLKGGGEGHYEPKLAIDSSARSSVSKASDTKNIISVPRNGMKYHTKEPWVEPGIDTQVEGGVNTNFPKIEISTPSPVNTVLYNGEPKTVRPLSVKSEPFVWNEPYPKNTIQGNDMTSSTQNNLIEASTGTMEKSHSVQITPPINMQVTSYREFRRPSTPKQNLGEDMHHVYNDDSSSASQKFPDMNTVDLLHMAGAAISHSTVNTNAPQAQTFRGSMTATLAQAEDGWIQHTSSSTTPLHLASATNPLIGHPTIGSNDDLYWNSDGAFASSDGNNGWIKDISQRNKFRDANVSPVNTFSGVSSTEVRNDWIQETAKNTENKHILATQTSQMNPFHASFTKTLHNTQLPPNFLGVISTTAAPIPMDNTLLFDASRKTQDNTKEQISLTNEAKVFAKNTKAEASVLAKARIGDTLLVKTNSETIQSNNNNNNNNDDDGPVNKPILLRLKGRNTGEGTLLIIKDKSTLIKFLKILKNMSIGKRRQMFKHLLKKKVNRIEFKKQTVKPKPETKPLKLMWTMSPKIIRVLQRLSKTATGRLILKSFRRQLKRVQNGAITGMSEAKTPQIQMKIVPTQSVIRTITKTVRSQISNSTPPTIIDDDNGVHNVRQDLEHNKRLFAKIQIVTTALKNRLRKALLIEKNLQLARKIVTALRLLEGRQRHLETQINFMQRQLKLINEPLVLKEPVVISVGNKRTVLMPSQFITRLKNNLTRNS